MRIMQSGLRCVLLSFASVTIMLAACDDASDDECSKDSDCRSDRVCEDGECVREEEPEQVDSGSKSCMEDNECAGLDCEHISGIDVGLCVQPCPEGTPCPNGTICIVGQTIGLDSSCLKTCSGAGGTCPGGLICAEYGEAGGAFACMPQEWTGGSSGGVGIGDSCTTAVCDEGTCNDLWCSRECQYSSDCDGTASDGGNNTSGFYNWCVPTAGGNTGCFPGCYDNADCAGYPGTTCQNGQTTEGVDIQACSI